MSGPWIRTDLIHDSSIFQELGRETLRPRADHGRKRLSFIARSCFTYWRYKVLTIYNLVPVYVQVFLIPERRRRISLLLELVVRIHRRGTLIKARFRERKS